MAEKNDETNETNETNETEKEGKKEKSFFSKTWMKVSLWSLLALGIVGGAATVIAVTLIDNNGRWNHHHGNGGGMMMSEYDYDHGHSGPFNTIRGKGRHGKRGFGARVEYFLEYIFNDDTADYDSDNNKRLSKEEYAAQNEDRFKKVDANADSSISEEEYLSFMKNAAERPLKAAFLFLDKDEDKLISLDEFNTFIKKRRGRFH